MEKVTPTQGRYLAYIHEYLDGFGLPPAESEIAETLGVSPPSVNQMMKMLEKKGFIRRQAGVARSIEILVADEAIPKWKGKRITRTVRQWVYVGPPARGRKGPGDSQGSGDSQGAGKDRKAGKGQKAGDGKRAGDAAVYRLKITLLDTDPPIWRRIETRDVTLGKLHELIQTAMGWENSHLHQFEVDGVRYSDPRFMQGEFEDFGAADENEIRIGGLVTAYGSKLKIGYRYDFGDCWDHAVVLEQVTQSEPGIRYPRCTAGERACPPEDAGGVVGFDNYLDAIEDPDHSGSRELLDWYGRSDPATFDAAKATRRMKKGLPAW